MLLRDSVSDVTELKGDERSPHMFEIVVDNSTRIQFICQSAADMHKWVSLITLAITSTVRHFLLTPKLCFLHHYFLIFLSKVSEFGCSFS